MDTQTRSIFIKIGAYLMLVVGIIFSLVILLLGVAMITSMPELQLDHKSIIAGLIMILGVIVFLIIFAVFESMIELTIVGEKLLEESAKEEKIING